MKSGAPQYGLCEGGGGLGAHTQEILRCYMCSGAPEALFSACTQTYISASCHLGLAVSDQKVRP